MEFDWSDKKEADELDTKCAILRNEDTNKQFYPGAARFQEMYALLSWTYAYFKAVLSCPCHHHHHVRLLKVVTRNQT